MIWDKEGLHLHIDEWCGRLGNNIQQLCCAIFIAEKTNSIVTFLPHSIIPDARFDFSKKDANTNTNDTITIRDSFFHYATICKNFLPLYNYIEQRRICESYVRPLFKSILEHPLPAHLTLSANDLVIHIRSGDVYVNRSHPLYVQDPFSYYKTILYNELFVLKKYGRVIILTEPDRVSPCIELIKNYIDTLNLLYAQECVGIDVKSAFEYMEVLDYSTCINMLLSAENVVVSNSSFSQRLSMCNTSLKNLYVSSLSIAEKQHQTAKRIHFYQINNYMQHGEWKNTPDQVKLMIEHKMSDVHKLTYIHLDASNENGAESKVWSSIKLPAHFIKGVTLN